ncbi:hypothetical protein KPATCC21470_0668 [Kitasatospora purpeofusca]
MSPAEDRRGTAPWCAVLWCAVLWCAVRPRPDVHCGVREDGRFDGGSPTC